MQDFQKRVVDEQVELDGKIRKLVDFMHGDIYASLPAIDQGLMMVQLDHMRMYSEALGRRIERFGC